MQTQPQNKTRNPLHGIMIRDALCVYLRDRPTRVKEPVVRVRLWWIISGNTQITQSLTECAHASRRLLRMITFQGRVGDV